jgi:serine/threonine protein phosphatase 1
MATTPKLFAIGDVHGHFRELMGLYDRLVHAAELEPERDTLVFLGDLVDGGPQTRDVVAWCMAMAEEHPHWVFLKGNHEDLLLDALVYGGRVYGDFALWWRQGGRETAASYPDRAAPGATPLARARAGIPRAHLRWLHDRPHVHETERHIFVHAGLRPGVPLAAQRLREVLWIREEFLRSPDDFGGKRVVFGHTPLREPLVRPNKLGLDTMVHGRGALTAAELSGPAPVFYRQPALAGPWPAQRPELRWTESPSPRDAHPSRGA